MGIQAKSPYSKYYQDLENVFGEPRACEESVEKQMFNHINRKYHLFTTVIMAVNLEPSSPSTQLC